MSLNDPLYTYEQPPLGQTAQKVRSAGVLSALNGFFERRYRGARLIDIFGICLAVLMMFWLCLSKVREGEDVKRLNELNDQIADEQAQVDHLKVKVSHLESPERLEALATNVLKMGTIKPDHEAQIDSLPELSGLNAKKSIPQNVNIGSSAPTAVVLPQQNTLVAKAQVQPQKTNLLAPVAKPAATSSGLKIQVIDPDELHHQAVTTSRGQP